jgi:hypothetical protein
MQSGLKENEGGSKATDCGCKPAYTLGYPGCGWEAVVNMKAGEEITIQENVS